MQLVTNEDVVPSRTCKKPKMQIWSVWLKNPIKHDKIRQEKIRQAGKCTYKHRNDASKQVYEQMIVQDIYPNMQQNAKMNQAKWSHH